MFLLQRTSGSLSSTNDFLTITEYGLNGDFEHELEVMEVES